MAANTSLLASIEAARNSMRYDYDRQIALLEQLARQSFAADAEVMRRVQELISTQQNRRADIVQALEQLATSIGLMPPEPQQNYYSVDQVSGARLQ